MKRMCCLAASALLGVCILSGCATPKEELERVAKDWCLTIRASQVLPVYPLTEDLAPGDVFLVQTPLSQQTKIYEKRGFLALEQQITRLHDLPYDEYYKNAYFKGTYLPGDGGHERPGWPPSEEAVLISAPQAAFPTYNFSVQRGGGLKLAIPIQGVPVGLGLMGASRATGSVELKDANTYGIDGASAYGALLDWWRSDPDIRDTLGAITQATGDEIYLRVVTRVYLVQGVTVSLTNLDALSGGADAGAAQSIQLPDLSSQDATEVEASAKAYAEALKAISGQLNDVSGGPGGSVRFVQASQRSVTLDETFDRPLVIGYVGFDVKVFDSRQLSPPIPSFSVLSASYTPSFRPVNAVPFSTEGLDEAVHNAYADWVAGDGNREAMEAWLAERGFAIDPADCYMSPTYDSLVREAAGYFGFASASD